MLAVNVLVVAIPIVESSLIVNFDDIVISSSTVRVPPFKSMVSFAPPHVPPPPVLSNCKSPPLSKLISFAPLPLFTVFPFAISTGKSLVTVKEVMVQESSISKPFPALTSVLVFILSIVHASLIVNFELALLNRKWAVF